MGLPSFQKLCFLLVFIGLLKISTSEPLKEEAKLFGGNFPAIYVIGDSLVDAGNNNNLMTRVKSNFPPYGSIFEGGKPTGRFSDGKTIADFIATYYGLPLAPAYMGLTEEEKNNISTGFNYASASCGIFPDTGKLMGQCLSLGVQVDLFNQTIEMNLKKKFKTQPELDKYLSESLFMLAIGVNDYAFFFRRTSNPNAFSSRLIHDYLIQIERLHKLGVRKFFVNNVKPLGCYPNMITQVLRRGTCNEFVNLAVQTFNTKLRLSLLDMKKRFKNTSFLYSDYFSFMMELRDPSKNEASPNPLNTTSPCCPAVYDGGLTTSCTPTSKACDNPDNYIFFDPFHPTQLANSKYASACFNGTNVCHVV